MYPAHSPSYTTACILITILRRSPAPYSTGLDICTSDTYQVPIIIPPMITDVVYIVRPPGILVLAELVQQAVTPSDVCM